MLFKISFSINLRYLKEFALRAKIKSYWLFQGNQNLGIMIIEGKHAEVGQGIFISDIQEGSAAEQAGLLVGDMILAVNKDTLLGSNYDAVRFDLDERRRFRVNCVAT